MSWRGYRLLRLGCSARLLLEASGKRALIVAEKGDLKAMRVLRRGKKKKLDPPLGIHLDFDGLRSSSLAGFGGPQKCALPP